MVPNAVRWRPDSKGFYIINRNSGHPPYTSATINELHYHDHETGSMEKVDIDWDRGMRVVIGEKAGDEDA